MSKKADDIDFHANAMTRLRSSALLRLKLALIVSISATVLLPEFASADLNPDLAGVELDKEAQMIFRHTDPEDPFFADAVDLAANRIGRSMPDSNGFMHSEAESEHLHTWLHSLVTDRPAPIVTEDGTHLYVSEPLSLALVCDVSDGRLQRIELHEPAGNEQSTAWSKSGQSISLRDKFFMLHACAVLRHRELKWE